MKFKKIRFVYFHFSRRLRNLDPEISTIATFQNFAPPSIDDRLSSVDLHRVFSKSITRLHAHVSNTIPLIN